MKRILLSVLLTVSAYAVPCNISAWYGEGQKEAILGIEWTNERFIFFGFKFKSALSGAKMLETIGLYEPRLHMEWRFNKTVVYGISWDADGNGIVNNQDWYRGGWDFGNFWSYWTKEEGPSNFSFSAIPSSDRIVEDGSIDLWQWNGNSKKLPQAYDCI